jgi:hypothetical protein
MIGPDDFIRFVGGEPVEVTAHVASILRNRPDFQVIDGTLGQKPMGLPKREVKAEPEVLEDTAESQNVAGIPHQPKFERLQGTVN